ncbi:MAG: PDDEXK nuclease domain-containing protein [Methanomassiliicoccaceae archaeon]|nr:PDDEXK nuclease domain-containing protein [Methanomassiliicoccaceae archaeon]
MDAEKESSMRVAAVIKDTILCSRYQAASLVNKELLSLYYTVGRYISQNSRDRSWGEGAIKQISDNLQRELPGLRGFSVASIKRMRSFYEAWQPVFSNRPSPMGELETIKKTRISDEKNNPEILLVGSKDETILDLNLLSEEIVCCTLQGFSSEEFYRVSFTHHSEILAKEKSLDGRLYYIGRCANDFWSVDTLKSNLRGDLFSSRGSLPSNFSKTLPPGELANRALKTFKQEYMFDYLNIDDEDDPDERMIEGEIVANIKKFILSFGDKFCFIGNQYRLTVDGKEFFIDLLFFNRELHCLVAIELKRGEFKPSYLGQLNFYLSVLDDYVRMPDEAGSVGIILCKEANRTIVELAVRDYTKPMGVASYRTRNEMPDKLQKALPDLEEIKRLLDDNEDKL